jgi:hypothetical protein
MLEYSQQWKDVDIQLRATTVAQWWIDYNNQASPPLSDFEKTFLFECIKEETSLISLPSKQELFDRLNHSRTHIVKKQ